MKALGVVIECIFQALAAIIILFNIGEIKANKNFKRIILAFLFSFLFVIISYYFISNNIRFFYSIIWILLITVFILKQKINKSFIVSFITMIIMSISEILSTLLFSVFSIPPTKLITNFRFNILSSITTALFAIIIVKILKKQINIIIKYFNNAKKSMLYIFILIFGIYLLIVKNSLFYKINVNLLLNVGILIVLIVLFIIFLFSLKENTQLQEKNKETLEYVQKYERIITEQGKTNHEYKNQLMVIKGYADMNSPKLKDYLNSVIGDAMKTASTYLISQLNKFPDGGIKGMVYFKLGVMDDKKIKYDIYSEEPAKKIVMALDVDDIKAITKILGVLIDNAIDAASHCRKERKVNISLAEIKNGVLFTVSNTFSGKLQKDKIGTGYTTKGTGHGYGLRLVGDIINSKSNYSFETFIKEEMYNAKLTIITKKRKSK